MRFDDMLATLLAQPAPTPEARAVLWRQVVDVLAQGRGHRVDDPLVDAPRAVDAYNFLRSVRPEIPVDLRLAAGRGLAGRRVPSELVLLFAEDLPHIAAPMLGHVILGNRQWLDLLPRLTPSARNLLRNRRDLGYEVEKALEGFGPSDFLIPGPVETAEASLAPLAAPIEDLVAEAQAPEATVAPVTTTPPMVEPEQAPPSAATDPILPAGIGLPGETQIRDLLSRIETFRNRYPANGEAEAGAAVSRVENFRFETGVDGVICWVQGVPRGPVIGETIAVAAHQTDHGVDGHAAGAYRSRTPFRDARLTIAGQGPASGEWRISAVPFFDPKDGRFSGYRGTARRPRADESAIAMTGEARAPRNQGINDSLRHLVHELRTPLNAIIGFSEMIEGQVRGPAAAAYRSRAQDILDQSKKLMSAVEDLDIVASARPAEAMAPPAPVDAAAILTRLHTNFEAAAKEHASGLAFRIDETLPPVAVDAPTVERMLSRLLAATIAMAVEGERISVDLQRDPRRSTHLLLTLLRPRALDGRDEKMLLDPGYNPDGNWPDAPVLGLGFALRLVRNLAIASGGMLEIDATRFYLSLPISQGRAEQDAG
ncbi:sensor histidine kinase [Rhizorhabdus dicambivorans]|uniref:sensor histidine kinase n=1 Tax=Rhizorhabdus dicambivorans TaxID=1850238 RepID=UPI00082E9E02|nr:histidine kinase dimerization/phospho-acceptor domain-containing protein [Rhizorhabdus dicambivorans]